MSFTYNITTGNYCPTKCLFKLYCKNEKGFNSKCRLWNLRYKIFKVLSKRKCNKENCNGSCWNYIFCYNTNQVK